MIAHVQDTDRILVGGDFNFVFNSKLDRKKGTAITIQEK